MGGPGKPGGKNPPAGWSAIDEEWEGTTHPQGLQEGPAGSRSVTEPLAEVTLPSEELIPAAPIGEEPWLDDGPTAQRAVDRALPVAPPGQHRVAKTIMGVGVPELQALFKEKLGEAPPSARPQPAPPVPPVPPAPAPSAPQPAPAGAPTPWDLDLSAKTQPRGPTEAEVHAMAGTAPMPLFAEEPTDAAAAPASDATPPPPPDDSAMPPIPSASEPRPIQVRSAPAIKPRLAPAARPSGPSNWVLIALWVVAILSVGLAVYLYVR
jgi:hypothetical protein